MSETVRFVSDGEELVLSEGEVAHIRSTPEVPEPAVPPQPPKAVVKFAVQYRGFRDADGRREYLLDARRGEESRRYTVWIALAAFAAHRARFQDGPDITYQKLVRELAESALEGSDCIAISEGDLSTYLATHATPVRRSFANSRPPETA